MSVSDVEWFAKSWTVSELLENNDPDGIVELVGDWVEENCSYQDEQEWSDLCFVFYQWWGCAGIPSHTPEWNQFWQNKLKEEQDCDS